MKNFVLLSLFALVSTFIYGQEISRLDSANGFKIFKLGTSKDLYANYIKNSEHNETNNTYTFDVNKSPTLGSAFGSPTGSISLQFDENDQLQSITIMYRLLANNYDADTDDIFKEAKILLMKYGAASETYLDNPTSKYYRWIGKKIVLTLNIKIVRGSDADYWHREVVFQNYADTIAGKSLR